mmetsp:Transcript_15326/g.37712  ORF Transcript_15326/g.37712 Transcript_15326/m.37712 type:complete len:721 (-) Transcript_15326:282-2444(-)
MRKSPTQHGMLTLSTVSAILLWCQVGRSAALQQNPMISLASRRQISFYPPMTCQWSAPVDEMTMEETAVVDFDWDEQFEELLSFKEEYGHSNFPVNPPTKLNKEYPTLAIFCHAQRLEYLRTKKIKRKNTKMALSSFDRRVRFHRLQEIGFEFNFLTAPSWYDKYHELLEYRRHNGHVRVSKNKQPLLYAWICNQRKRRKGTKGYAELPDNRIELLDKIGFEWESEFNEILWMAKYKELVDFRSKHGHLEVHPQGPLYLWMDAQRSRGAGKEGHAPLLDKQIRLLDDIEFPWVLYRHEAKWDKQYEELVRFQKDHGHCKPSKSTNQRLESWMQYQRLKREKGLLSNKQIELLDKIEFPWESDTPKWIEMYKELNAYHNEHGHLRVTSKDDPRLYDWLEIQRRRYHGTIKPALSDEQIERIELMSFCWSSDSKDRTWHEKYTEAVEFYKQNGHVRVTKKNNLSLYNWIEMQGKRYKEIKGQKPLSEEELELLEQLDFPFLENQPCMAWNEMYADLVKYQRTHKGRFPVRHNDDPELNRWMRHQRNRMRCAYGYVPLSDEQNALLESIAFPMLPQGFTMRKWCARYDQLFDFWKQHGNFLVSFDEDPILHRWIDIQRSRYKGQSISPRPLTRSERYLLDRIDFPWKSDRDEVHWQMRYQELVQFWEKHGHLRVPASEPEHQHLFYWIKNQRQNYCGTGRGHKLPEHKIKQLEKIGFTWPQMD